MQASSTEQLQCWLLDVAFGSVEFFQHQNAGSVSRQNVGQGISSSTLINDGQTYEIGWFEQRQVENDMHDSQTIRKLANDFAFANTCRSFQQDGTTCPVGEFEDGLEARTYGNVRCACFGEGSGFGHGGECVAWIGACAMGTGKENKLRGCRRMLADLEMILYAPATR